MKILALPRYGLLGASSRLRINQYFPYFSSAGIEVTSHVLLSDDYVSALYARRSAVMTVVQGYVMRLRMLLKAKSFDALLVEKESLPWIPTLIELGLYRDIPLWVDYDDAVFHRYDLHSLSLVRAILGKKLDAVMRRANLVTVGNAYLASRARSAGSQWIERVPTVIDLSRYSGPPTTNVRQQPIVIGWIGSPSTAAYLQLVSEVMTRLSGKHNIRCIAIGARPDQLLGTPFQALPWSEATEVESIRGMDIGIMPLPDTPWERGKCGYKLIQYMACGLPVVASPVGVNGDIVDTGKSGFLAGSTDAWIQSLESLIVDASMRKNMGSAGRRRVEQEFCSQVQGPRLVKMLHQLVAT